MDMKDVKTEKQYAIQPITDITQGNLEKIIMDFEDDLPRRIIAIDLFIKNNHEISPLFNTILSMYNLSHLYDMNELLMHIATTPLIDIEIRVTYLIHLTFMQDKSTAVLKKYLSNHHIKLPHHTAIIHHFIKQNDVDDAIKHLTNFAINDKFDSFIRLKEIIDFTKEHQIKPLGTFIREKSVDIYARIEGCHHAFNAGIEDSVDVLYDIMTGDYPERARANSADLLIYIDKHTDKALDVIQEIGTSHATFKTIYENKENVHDNKIQESLNDVYNHLSILDIKDIKLAEIENVLLNHFIINTFTKIGPIKTRVLSLQTDVFESAKYKAIRRTFVRIQCDRRRYSQYRYSLVDIVKRIWVFIHNFEKGSDERTSLIDELMHECISVAGVCSTGYATRLLNVLSGFGGICIQTSWKQQIYAYFTNHVQHLVKKHDCEELLCELGQKDRPILNQFIIDHIGDISEYLTEEFKDYLPDDELNEKIKSIFVKFGI